MTNEDVELDLCLLLTTKISNWSLDLEQCPIELDLDQSLRLHDLGMESLIKKNGSFAWLFGFVVNWNCDHVQNIFVNAGGNTTQGL